MSPKEHVPCSISYGQFVAHFFLSSSEGRELPSVLTIISSFRSTTGLLSLGSSAQHAHTYRQHNRRKNILSDYYVVPPLSHKSVP